MSADREAAIRARLDELRHGDIFAARRPLTEDVEWLLAELAAAREEIKALRAEIDDDARRRLKEQQ